MDSECHVFVVTDHVTCFERPVDQLHDRDATLHPGLLSVSNLILKSLFASEDPGMGRWGGLSASRRGGTCRLNLGKGPAVFYSRLLARCTPCMRDPPRQPADLSFGAG